MLSVTLFYLYIYTIRAEMVTKNAQAIPYFGNVAETPMLGSYGAAPLQELTLIGEVRAERELPCCLPQLLQRTYIRKQK